MASFVVKFNKNWADEFDVEQTVIYHDVSRQYIDERIEAVDNSSYWFGTNEGWSEEYGDLISRDDFTVTEIADDAAKVIVETLRAYPEDNFVCFGIGPL